MSDKSAVIWTRLATEPLKMGSLYVTESDCRFTYNPDYIDLGLPGLSLVYPPAAFRDLTITRPHQAQSFLLPPLQSLIPPQHEHNFQRQLLLKYLQQQPTTKDVLRLSEREQDWALLMVSGRGGIGHLDVFVDDDEALRWYARPDRTQLHLVQGKLGFSLKEFLHWYDEHALQLLDIIGPTPSVGGAIPKLLLSIARSGWDGRIGLPSRIGDTHLLDVVVKLEKSSAYPGIVELESLALDVHAENGFSVPRHWTTQINGIPALLIERFDRDPHGVPLFFESLFSVLASGSHKVTGHTAASYDMIARALDHTEIRLVDDPIAAKHHLFKRLIYALLTGNGDLHLENLGLLRQHNQVGFSPVYDPTPMRAYPLHNMLMVMPFGKYGEWDDHASAPVHFNEAMDRFVKLLRMDKSLARAEIDQCMSNLKHYPERVQQLNSLPDLNKEELVRVYWQVHALFKTYLRHSKTT